MFKHLITSIIFFNTITASHETATIPSRSENKFVMVIPSYNNKYWFQRNLDSVFMQTYKNYRIIYIDDASKDRTGELVEKYIQQRGFSDKATVIKNKTNRGALANLYTAISTCKPDEIIVDLDGDDWLANENVLSKLNEIYKDPDTWVTYGQFCYYPQNCKGWASQLPQDIIDSNSFRSYSWVTTHLRTFYAGLFHKIKRSDLLYEGDFFQMASDVAFMIPIIEMAGNHSKFIPDILYIYNRATPISDDILNRDLQLRLNRDILSRPKYNKIDRPYDPENVDPKKKIYITPGQWGVLFDLNNKICNRDDCLQPVYQLKIALEKLNFQVEEAHTLENLHDAEFIITFEIPIDQLDTLKQYPKEKLIAFLWEPPSVEPLNYDKKYHEHYSKIYTWNDNLVDNKKYFKLHYAVKNPMIDDVVPFEDKKLCSLICSNKGSRHKNELYSTRLNLINFYEKRQNLKFDLYGKFWSNKYRNFKGLVDRKVDVLSHYKFSYAYENIKGLNGYITEKIFDCFRAGCIPIYLGSSNIEDYIPKNCYIDREEFEEDRELYQFMQDMSKEQYNQYIRNIKDFLDSDKAELYSINNFIQTFLDLCLPK